MEKKHTKGKTLPNGFSLWKPFPQTAKRGLRAPFGFSPERRIVKYVCLICNYFLSLFLIRYSFFRTSMNSDFPCSKAQ